MDRIVSEINKEDLPHHRKASGFECGYLHTVYSFRNTGIVCIVLSLWFKGHIQCLPHSFMFPLHLKTKRFV